MTHVLVDWDRHVIRFEGSADLPYDAIDSGCQARCRQLPGPAINRDLAEGSPRCRRTAAGGRLDP